MLPLTYLTRETLPNGLVRMTLRDPRAEGDELLWPERFPEETVKELETDLGPFAAAQLQQDPVPATGGIFQADWFERHWLPHELPKFSTLIQSWDMRFKDASSSGDWVVGQVWGMSRGMFYLLDQVRGRWGFVATCDQVKALTVKWPRAHTKLVEAKANGDAVIDVLQKDIPGFEAIEPEGGKEARAWGISGYYRSGNVLLPPVGTEYLPGFLSEHLRFPKGTHDDQVDAATQALLWLSLRVPKLVEAMKAVEDERRAEVESRRAIVEEARAKVLAAQAASVVPPTAEQIAAVEARAGVAKAADDVLQGRLAALLRPRT